MCLVALYHTFRGSCTQDIPKHPRNAVKGQLRGGKYVRQSYKGKTLLTLINKMQALFNTFIKTVRNHIFNGGAERLLDRLGQAADSIGKALEIALEDLSQKVCYKDSSW